MKKNISFLLIVIVSFTSAFSQSLKDKESHTYSIINENTQLNYISIGLEPFDMQVGKTFYMGVAPNLTLLYHNLFLNVEYVYHYVSADLGLGEPMNGESIFDQTNSNELKILGGYYFTRIVDGKVPFGLKRIGKIDYFTEVNAKYEKFWGIEAGVEKGVKLIYATGKHNVLEAVNNNSTSIEGEFSTNMTYTWIYFGGSIGKLIDATADFSGIGKRSCRLSERVYAHVILSIHNELDDIYWNTSNSRFYYQYQLNKSITMTKIGFRIGYNVDYLRNILGGGPEIVLMPSIKGALNAIFRIKFCMGLNRILSK